MKDIIVKQDEQTNWYENGQLIEAYLKRSKKTPTAEKDIQDKKLSILEMLKAARTRDKNS